MFIAKPTKRQARRSLWEMAKLSAGIVPDKIAHVAAEPLPPVVHHARDYNKATEHDEQAALIHWWAHAHKKFGLPEIALYAVPNAGKRTMYSAVRLQAEGMRRGVPDLSLDAPVGKYHGMKIEMKVGKGELTDEQIEYGRYLLRAGYHFMTCWTCEDAITAITDYLKGGA